jgi:hypothetical protein
MGEMSRSFRLIGLGFFLFLSIYRDAFATGTRINQSATIVCFSNQQFQCEKQYLTQQVENYVGVQKPNSTYTETFSVKRMKNPNMALLYSVIPGFLIHGSGHVYAGDISTGIIIFGSELAGVGLMFLGGLGGFENGESTNDGDYAIFAGSVLFVGSWLYDIIESPMAVKKRNRKLLKQKSMGLEFRMKDAGPKLTVVWRF